jgi:serine/threonine protein kinase
MGATDEGAGRYLAPGHIVGNRYKIIRPLGSGGMASVYLAEDIVLGESTVAIKILRKGAHFKDDVVQRFLREVRLTHKINHENVVRTFDFGQEGDTLFYTMEYLAGSTVEALLSQGGIPIPSILSIAAQLMRGISAVHSVGVIHRDLKPANIMMLPAGRIKITDFGIARGGASMLTVSSGEIVGTITYLAPETLVGEEATIAVDYYALGAILYQLLTGEAPIDDDIPARVIMRKVEEAPRDPRELRPDAPEWLATGLMGLLEIDPKARMRSLSSFAAALDKHAPKQVDVSLVSNLVPNTLAIDQILMDAPLHTRVFRTMRRGTLVTKMMIALLAGLVFLPIATTETASRIELGQLDNLFVLRGPMQPSPDVMIVSMDEQSYSNLAVPLTSQWPRELHARLVNRLADAGARRVVFDILFVEPSVDAKNDEGFAFAMTRMPTFLGAAVGLSQQATLNGSYMLEELLKPAPIFASKAAGIGTVGFPVHFGRPREFNVERSSLFPEVQSLAEAASGLTFTGEYVGERDLINFYGPARTISTVPYYMVLAEDHPIPPEVFTDKVVFVGLNLKSRTGPSQREAFATPFDSNTFGTEIHATAASNLLMKGWIKRVSVQRELGIQGGVCAVFALIVLALSGVRLLLALPCSILGFLALQYGLFSVGLFVPMIGAVGCGTFFGLFSRIMLGNPLYGNLRRR